MEIVPHTSQSVKMRFSNQSNHWQQDEQSRFNPNDFCKNTATTIIKPLKILFNKYLSQMKYPTRWKLSFVSPIFKSGDKSNIVNYRPISIISAASKILKKLYLTISKVKHLITNKQHGFTGGKSTLSNLFEYNDYVVKNMVKGDQVDTVFTDMAKAFDRIYHTILLSKLREFPLD